jgi:predicted nicotinamide N-methyase
MRTIKVKYPHINHQRRLGQKLFVMEAIRDLDEAIDLVCKALTEEEQKDPFAEDLCPYFGILWEASEGLAQYLSNNPDLVKNKKILELGCGLGFPSLVAAHLEADVLATDFHPDVEEYFLRNCHHSSVMAKYQRLNWREDKTDIGLFDLVMGSDVLYESKHPREVVEGLMRFLRPEGIILLSDPGRAYLQNFVKVIQDYGYRDSLSIENVSGKEIFLFEFRKSS